ncbi:UDP-N-acetylmuramoylalanine--D-glutamate ligase [Rickettsiales bacterium (ex Bugula neritina AB1)]|nr:UDP-N-acetylmuramoylalanine--D-glutamate ligase [Rickettsiales bacterium (ex Bugula neritina AB1)]
MYTLLLGSGKNGLYTYNFLKKHSINIKVYDDSKTNYNLFFSHEIYENINEIDFKTIKEIIPTPGVSPNHHLLIESRKFLIPILSNLDILWKYGNKDNYYIGVTGSNGKTTTVSMISHFLKNKNIPHLLVGNIGKDIFKDKTLTYKGRNIYIIEVSSYQLHYTNYMIFNIGAITNICSNHEDWHGSFSQYKNDKLKIYTNNDYQGSFMGEGLKEVFYNKKITNTYLNKNKYNKEIRLIDKKYEIHNIKNFFLAFYIFNKITNYSINEAINCINNFIIPSHRCEIIINNNKYIVINDSKSTSITSTNVAIKFSQSFKKKIFLIMGHNLKGNINILDYYKISKFYIFGSKRNLIKNFLLKKSYNNFVEFENLKSCLKYLNQQFIEPGIYVFSPGGSSFEEFKNYEERGDFFKKEISKIF